MRRARLPLRRLLAKIAPMSRPGRGSWEDNMTEKTRFTRRTVMAGAAAATLVAPAVVRAQAQTLKIGSLLPRSGFFAQAG